MANQKWSASDVRDLIIEGLGGQSTDFVPTYEAVSTLLDKIGLTITLQSSIVDHLAMFDDVVLNDGTTVEEYVHDLLAVVDYDPNSQPYGQDPIDTKRAYHYRNSDKKIELPVWEDEMTRAFTSKEKFAEFVARMLQRINDTYQNYKFEAKKLAIGEKILRDHNLDENEDGTFLVNYVQSWQNLVDVGKDYTELAGSKCFITIDINGTNASIKDKATSEEFILAVQSIVEDMKFTNRKYNVFGVAQQSQPQDLVLLIRKGSMPIMNVRALATVFNKELLGLGIDVKVIDDFGLNGRLLTNEDTPKEIEPYAILTDKRIVRYMVTRDKTTVDINGNALRTLYTKHFGENVVTSDLINYVAFIDSAEI